MKNSSSARRQRRALATFAGVAGLAMLAASPAGAATGPGAYGESVNVNVAGIPVTSGPLPEVHAPGDGTTATNSALSVNASPLLTTGLLEVGSNQGFSQASVNNTNVLDGLVTATVIHAECTGPSGLTTLLGVAIHGQPAVDLTPAPNTTLLDVGGVKVVANRQFTSGGDFVVRAIEITLTDAPVGTGLANGTVVISEARCNKGAPIPVGAIGGLGLAGIVGVLFAGQLVITRRRRAAGASSTVG